MPGFSIREQLAIGRRMKDRRWRKDAFMHQLSSNGSLLLAPNHDPVWEDALWSITGRPYTGWTTNSHLLRLLPAGVVRRMLWHASLEWWRAMMTYRMDLADFASVRGIIDMEEIDLFDKDLERVARQLQKLSWCAVDTDKGRIDTV
jgi:hypothetical protein